MQKLIIIKYGELTTKKDNTKNDNKVLSKDELMLKYLLDNLEEQKRVKIKEGNSLEWQVKEIFIYFKKKFFLGLFKNEIKLD